MTMLRVISITTDEYNFITGADVAFVPTFADIRFPLEATQHLTLEELSDVLHGRPLENGVDYHVYKVAPDLYNLVSNLPAKDGWICWLDYLDAEDIGEQLQSIISPFGEEYLEVTVLFEGLLAHWPGYENDEDDEESPRSLPA